MRPKLSEDIIKKKRLNCRLTEEEFKTINDIKDKFNLTVRDLVFLAVDTLENKGK